MRILHFIKHIYRPAIVALPLILLFQNCGNPTNFLSKNAANILIGVGSNPSVGVIGALSSLPVSIKNVIAANPTCNNMLDRNSAPAGAFQSTLSESGSFSNHQRLNIGTYNGNINLITGYFVLDSVNSLNLNITSSVSEALCIRTSNLNSSDLGNIAPLAPSTGLLAIFNELGGGRFSGDITANTFSVPVVFVNGNMDDIRMTGNFDGDLYLYNTDLDEIRESGGSPFPTFKNIYMYQGSSAELRAHSIQNIYLYNGSTVSIHDLDIPGVQIHNCDSSPGSCP